jgi:hypothetical protein
MENRKDSNRGALAGSMPQHPFALTYGGVLEQQQQAGFSLNLLRGYPEVHVLRTVRALAVANCRACMCLLKLSLQPFVTLRWAPLQKSCGLCC